VDEKLLTISAFFFFEALVLKQFLSLVEFEFNIILTPLKKKKNLSPFRPWTFISFFFIPIYQKAQNHFS